MEDDNKAIVVTPTKQPDKEVADRTLVWATQPGKVVDEKSVGVLPEEEAPAVSKKRRSKKLRCCIWCCGLVSVLLVLLAIVIVILIFTVFKVKNPSINVTSVALQNVNLHIPTLFDPNLTVTAEIYSNATVHNPNAENFQYGNTTAQIFYHGEQVGVIPVAAGEVKAHSSENIFLPLQLTLSSDLVNGNLTKDIIDDQMLPLVSKVYIVGTVKVVLIKIHNVRISSECDINYYLNQTVSLHCQYNTKI